MDTFVPSKRSEIMRLVRSKGTGPEIIVRKILRKMGIKYRSCSPELPGKPDMVILRQQKAIFVHGCFWHGHRCDGGKLPKSNRSYWRSKQTRNALRDSRNTRALRSKGWKLMTVWECETSGRKRLEQRLSHFLRPQQ